MTALAALLLASALAAPGDHDVVPGERLGKIRIGMSAADVHAALGTPGGSYPRADGLVEEVWSGGKNDVQQVRVWLERGKAVQVSATSKAFKTKDGLSTGAEPAAIVALKLKRTGYSHNGSGGAYIYFYDDVARGIAWEISGPAGRAEPPDPQFGVYAAIVHATGRAVAVAEDFEPVEPDEVCAPETPQRCGE